MLQNWCMMSLNIMVLMNDSMMIYRSMMLRNRSMYWVMSGLLENLEGVERVKVMISMEVIIWSVCFLVTMVAIIVCWVIGIERSLAELYMFSVGY